MLTHCIFTFRSIKKRRNNISPKMKKIPLTIRSAWQGESYKVFISALIQVILGASRINVRIAAYPD